MKKILLLLIINKALLFTLPTNSQVLWSDNFDSYPIGPLSTDPKGINPGYGGWFVKAPDAEIKIVSETGKGNVMAKGWWGSLKSGSTHANASQSNIDVLWMNRIQGNDIFKLEFDMYAENVSSSSSGSYIGYVWISGKNPPFISEFLVGLNDKNVLVMGGGTAPKVIYGYKKWIKVEIFIDYNTNSVYYYVPNLFYRKENFKNLEQPYKITTDVYINGNVLPFGSFVKFDNFKASAVNTLPNYLSVNEFLNSKFNLFPNPATNIVNITSSEQLPVKQVAVYDVTGKLIHTQDFNNEAEIQLNVDALATGTYLLHLKTDQGIAVKKLVRK